MNNKRAGHVAQDIVFWVCFCLLVFGASYWLFKILMPPVEPQEIKPLLAPTGFAAKDVAGNVVAPFEFSSAVLAEPDDFRADIRAAVELIAEHFSYLEHRRKISNLDLGLLEERALALLGDQPTAVSFKEALTVLIAGLCDGHAAIAQKKFVRLGEYRWPFSLVEVEEGVIVDGLNLVAGSSPYVVPPIGPGESDPMDTIQRGDVLIAVAGRPIEDWIEEAQSFVFSSTDAARRRMAIQKLGRFDKVPVREFKFNRPGKGEF